MKRGCSKLYAREHKELNICKNILFLVILVFLININFVFAVENCTDTDFGNYYVFGLCTDSFGNNMSDGCIVSNGPNNGYLREIACDNRNGNLRCEMDDYNCPNGCISGACISEATCIDSDGGLDIYNFGWTEFKAGSFESKHEDACALVSDYDSNGNPSGWQSTNSCSGENCYIEEAFCRTDDKGNFIDADADKLIKCANGCADGACLK